MIVKKVQLRNFRNYEEFELDFRKKMTLVVGDNGSGKTSVVEAVYLALRGKSFRGNDSDMMRRGSEYYRVVLEKAKESVNVKYDGEKRFFETKGKVSSRLPAQEKYPVVLFLPSDLNLVGASPQRKREYFDGILSMVDDNYRRALTRYNKALRQRNEILKNGNSSREGVFAWDVMLSRYGVLVGKARRRLKQEINDRFSKEYQGIAGRDDVCELCLGSTTTEDEGGYLRRLEEMFSRDQMVGYTGFGVHRDDWSFRFNAKEADGNASRGEMRSMVLALKFIEAEMIEKELGKKPLILLDDVFSELDNTRQRRVAENFTKNQMIVTSVREPEID